MCTEHGSSDHRRCRLRQIRICRTADPLPRRGQEQNLYSNDDTGRGSGKSGENPPKDLGQVELPENSAVLLEDIPNLLANALFMPNGSGIHAGSMILSGFRRLVSEARDVIAVTDDVFCDGCEYQDSTKLYMQLLGLISQDIVCEADHVTEVVYGIPVVLK